MTKYIAITGNIIEGNYIDAPQRSCKPIDHPTSERITVTIDGTEYNRAIYERVIWRNQGENTVAARFVIVNGVNYEVAEVEDEPEGNDDSTKVDAKNSAEFRAMRESLGLTQQRLADLLGVRVLSVKRWESPKYPQQAPLAACELLDSMMQRQDSAVQAALAQIDETAKDMDDYPSEVVLPYWASSDDYALYHYHDDGSAESWAEVNATNRRVAFALRERGITVRWVDGANNPVPKQ